jgi:hypothetical protein
VSERLHTIAKKNVNGTRGATGQSIDEETTLASKRLLNHLGIESSNISIQNPESKRNKNVDVDFRTNHPSNKKLNELGGACDFVSSIGSTPRYDAPLLNVRIRQLVIKKNITIASIGFPTDLTYPVNQSGNGMKTLYRLAQGKHCMLRHIPQAKNPNIILGYNAFQREDGDSFRFICD